MFHYFRISYCSPATNDSFRGLYFQPYKATLKKKFVSCPAAGHTSGQSGGRNFPPPPFFSLYRNGRENAGKRSKKLANVKKMCRPGTNKLTRVGDRKPNYFEGWPNVTSYIIIWMFYVWKWWKNCEQETKD